MQTKKHSLIESLTNVAVGFGISLAATFAIFPLVGIASNGTQNLVVTVFYTIISIARSYVIRRYFNRPKHIPLTELSIKQLGFDFNHAYFHDEYCTRRYSYDAIDVEFTYDGPVLVTCDVTINEVFCKPVTYNELKSLIQIFSNENT